MIVTWEDVLRQQKTVRNCALVAGVLAFIGLVAGFATITTRSGWFFLLLLVPSGLMFLMFYFARKTYREMYKSVVVNKAAEGMFDSYSYKYDSGFESNEIRDAGLMTMGNRYNSEDMVEGFYKGVSFRRADLYIAQHVQTGKSSYTIVYLRGEWLMFTYNKNFVSDVQVTTRNFNYANKKKSRLFNRADERRHTFETESKEFNREFTCTCQEESEAFYLLTPRVMQMLLLLKSEFDCPFMVGFVKNRLHFAINSGKNTMEPPVLSEPNLTAEVEKARRELKIICNIVDTLDLDRRLFVQ